MVNKILQTIEQNKAPIRRANPLEDADFEWDIIEETLKKAIKEQRTKAVNADNTLVSKVKPAFGKAKTA